MTSAVTHALDGPRARWTAAGLWMVLLWWLSSRPVLPGPDLPFLDKAEHGAAYAVLAMLLARALLPVRALASRPIAERWSLIILACTLYGVFDELHQAFVPGRFPDAWDVAADAGGALAAALVLGAARRPRV